MIAHARYYYSSRTCTPQPTPAPFRQFLVYSAQGAYDPLAGPFPDGCSPPDPLISTGVCTDMERVFHKKIMRFSEEQIKAEERRAKEFYLERFGLDADRLLEEGRVALIPWLQDPRQDYRVFIFSGECVPSEGYKVRDGGFILAITDPRGVDLGGEFEGQKAPAGSGVLFGLYNILITGRHPREEVMRYRARGLLAPSQGVTAVDCDLYHPVWGEGLLQGTVFNKMLEGGHIQATRRSVLTFPPFGEP